MSPKFPKQSVAKKPNFDGDYLEHQFINGMSVHAFDPLLGEHFVRYFITYPNGSTHQVDKMGAIPFHVFHLEELCIIIENDLRHNCY